MTLNTVDDTVLIMPVVLTGTYFLSIVITYGQEPISAQKVIEARNDI